MIKDNIAKMSLSVAELDGDREFFDLLAVNLEIEADGGDSAGDFVRHMVLKTRKQIRLSKLKTQYEELLDE